MKMDEFKKLFKAKRILALTLAAAMTVTSLPATASAAEPESETVIETSESSETKETGTKETETKETETKEAASTEKSDEESKEDSDGSTAGDEAQETTDESEIETQENAAPNAEAQQAVTYTIDTSALREEHRTAVYDQYESPFQDKNYDEDDYEIGYANFTSWQIRDEILLKSEKDEYRLSDMENEVVPNITYTWKVKGTGNTYTNLPENTFPRDAGEYQLEIVLPKADGRYSEAKASVDFTITKAPVEVAFSPETIKPGSTKADIKIDAEGTYGEASDGKRFSYNAETPADSELVFSDIKVKKVSGNAELADTDKFTRNEEYVVEAAVKFTDKVSAEVKKNYQDPVCEPQKITVGSLKETKTEITLTGDTWKDKVTDGVNQDGRPINFVSWGIYTGSEQNPFTDGSYTAKISELTGTDQEGNSTFAEITGAAADKGVWYTAESFYSGSRVETGADGSEAIKWTYSYSTGDMLDGNPVDAGTYIYRITYNNEAEGIYKKSFADVLVEIKKASVSVVPVIEGNDTGYYQGIAVSEVLKNVDYKVYDVESNTDITDKIDKTRFFTDRKLLNYTQPYEPVFEVVRIKTDKDGEIIDTQTLTNKLNSELTEQEITDGYKESFKVRFRGKIAVYQADGTYSSEKNVATENPNYKVVNNYDDKAVEIKMNNAAAAVIDVSGIISGYRAAGYTQIPGVKNGDEDIIVLTKVYDGKPFYESRGEYKKAEVKSGGTSLAKDTDAALAYELRFSSNTPDAAEIEAGNRKVTSLNYNSSANGNVGVYRLRISYTDETAQYHADTKDVYFVIERRRAKLVPDGEYRALTDTSVASFINEYRRSGKVMLYDGSNWVDSIEGVTTPSVSYSSSYWNPSPDWKVKKEVTLADGKKEYQPVDDYDLFEKDNKYKAAVMGVTWQSRNFTDDDIKTVETAADGTKTVKSTPVYTDADDKDIILENMGTAELKAADKTTASKPYTGEAVSAEEIAAIETAAKAAKKADGTDAGVEFALSWDYTSRVECEDDWEFVYDEDGNLTFIHAGTYTLYASYKGDTTYKPFGSTAVAELVITPADLKISPKKLGDTVEAQPVWNITDADNYEFSGVVSADKDAFTWQNTYEDSENMYYVNGYHAFEYDWDEYDNVYCLLPGLAVYDNAGRQVSGSLKGAAAYTLRVLGEGELRGRYKNDYKVTLGSQETFTTVHGRSSLDSVKAVDKYYSVELDAGDTYTKKVSDNGVVEYAHNIIFREGIPYSYNEGYGKGNYVTVRIKIPSEYDRGIPDTAVYEKSIEAARGEVISTSGSYLAAKFNAAEKSGDKCVKKNSSFTIRWAEGHTETFNLLFEQTDLEADLTQAAAPKSLAFNSPKTKMAAGESQALDVKIAKAQNDDIIWLQYKVTAGDSVAVNKNTGVIRALKEGVSTVAVYPVKADDNGDPVEIPGAKQAVAKITVSKVAAPKITKVIPKGSSIQVQYKYVENDENTDNYGWRREIYVMKGSSVSAKTFEDAITAMRNQNWQKAGFAAAPIFRSNATEDNYRIWKNDKKTDITSVYIGSLDPNEQYTVYVRNVSKIDQFNDGEKVHDVVLSYNGAVKSAKTTLPQVKDLRAEIKDKEAEDEYDDFDLEEDNYYRIDLTEKSAVISVKGRFDKTLEDPAADSSDMIWKDLPITDSFKSKIAAPKLTYTVNPVYRDYYYDEGEAYYYYYVATNVKANAKVDKKGKITFKQPETIAVTITDTISGEWTRVIIDVTAKADSITGRTVTMEVGQGINLENLVTYKMGRTVLNTNVNYAHRITVTKELQDKFKSNGFELSSNGRLLALKEAAESFDLTDQYIANSKATVKIKVKPLQPVKNLNIVNVIDNRFTVQWSVPNCYPDGYRIDVTDARGSLVKSVYVGQYENSSWNSVKKAYVFNRDISGLTTQCKYTVKVTALFRDQTAKAVSKTVTTTKLPASEWDLGTGEYNEEVTETGEYWDEDEEDWFEYEETYYRGMPVTTLNTANRFGDVMWERVEDDNGEEMYSYFNERYDIAHAALVSGNSYTLVAHGEQGANYAATDKLIWTSSNKKIATVKAVGGTYGANLKALRAGTAIIEVKSSITRKVIARYKITIRPVQCAHKNKSNGGYYGDNETLRYEE